MDLGQQWWEETRCSTPGLVTDDDLFPEKWQRHPTVRMTRCCTQCPVRTQCLQRINERDPTVEDDGVYGGLTSYERRQMLRHQKRAKCPSCGGVESDSGKDTQICVSCGHSWSTILTKKTSA